MSSTHAEYENYAWNVSKDGETVGAEDPKCANHLMSGARYALRMFAGSGSMYDPSRAEREHVQVDAAAVDEKPSTLMEAGDGGESAEATKTSESRPGRGADSLV